MIAAIQYGNIVAIARCLDLSVDIRVPGCFRLLEGKGRLHFLNFENNREGELHTMQEEHSIVFTGATDNVPSYVSRFAKTPIHFGPLPNSFRDESPPNFDMCLYAIPDGVCWLDLRIHSQGHRCFIDPSSCLGSIIYVPYWSCEHPVPVKLSVLFQQLL